MLALRLSPDIEKRLCLLAERTGRTKSYYAKLAITEFLEDQEDYYIAAERFRDELPAIPFDEAIKKLGISKDELEN